MWATLHHLWKKMDKQYESMDQSRTVPALEARRENLGIALAGQLSVFFCRCLKFETFGSVQKKLEFGHFEVETGTFCDMMFDEDWCFRFGVCFIGFCLVAIVLKVSGFLSGHWGSSGVGVGQMMMMFILFVCATSRNMYTALRFRHIQVTFTMGTCLIHYFLDTFVNPAPICDILESRYRTTVGTWLNKENGLFR